MKKLLLIALTFIGLTSMTMAQDHRDPHRPAAHHKAPEHHYHRTAHHYHRTVHHKQVHHQEHH